MQKKKDIAKLLLCIALYASQAWAQQENFHAPETAAEKSLDAALIRSNKDSNLVEFVLNTPYYRPAKNMDYQNIFTHKLLRDLAVREAAMVHENCGGKYIPNEICGFDYNPISCSQDPPDKYAYRTQLQTEQTAIILSGIPHGTVATATYTLIKQHGRWRIDGIDCGGNARFNMP